MHQNLCQPASCVHSVTVPPLEGTRDTNPITVGTSTAINFHNNNKYTPKYSAVSAINSFAAELVSVAAQRYPPWREGSAGNVAVPPLEGRVGGD